MTPEFLECLANAMLTTPEQTKPETEQQCSLIPRTEEEAAAVFKKLRRVAYRKQRAEMPKGMKDTVMDALRAGVPITMFGFENTLSPTAYNPIAARTLINDGSAEIVQLETVVYDDDGKMDYVATRPCDARAGEGARRLLKVQQRLKQKLAECKAAGGK